MTKRHDNDRAQIPPRRPMHAVSSINSPNRVHPLLSRALAIRPAHQLARLLQHPLFDIAFSGLAEITPFALVASPKEAV